MLRLYPTPATPRGTSVIVGGMSGVCVGAANGGVTGRASAPGAYTDCRWGPLGPRQDAVRPRIVAGHVFPHLHCGRDDAGKDSHR
jgi:hypothetical protein